MSNPVYSLQLPPVAHHAYTQPSLREPRALRAGLVQRVAVVEVHQAHVAIDPGQALRGGRRQGVRDLRQVPPGELGSAVNLPTASGGASRGQTSRGGQCPATIRRGDSKEKAGAADLVSRATSTWPFTPAASAKPSEAGPLSGFFP